MKLGVLIGNLVFFNRKIGVFFIGKIRNLMEEIGVKGILGVFNRRFGGFYRKFEVLNGNFWFLMGILVILIGIWVVL
jgi:hypothetical protein